MKSFTSGVITALVTPFKNGALDTKAFEALLERQANAGIAGVVVCGTTGESPTVSHDEWLQLLQIAKNFQKKLAIIAGVGGNYTENVIKKTRIASEVGVDAVLAVTPYYNKPPQWCLEQHYSAVARATELPIILYNVPGRTNVDLEPETVQRLWKFKTIVGLKEASGNVERFADYRIRMKREDLSFALLSGDDPLFASSLEKGASGIISVVTNVWPELFVEIYQHFISEDHTKARHIQSHLEPMMKVLYSVTNPIGIKWFGAQREYWHDELRLPLASLRSYPEGEARFREFMKNHPHPEKISRD